jgi:hypothetical protein
MTLANFFTIMAAFTGKTTPVGADSLALVDSAASNAAKNLTLTNLVAYLKTAIATDTLAAPTDITTNNATTSAHGLLKKLSNVATEFMNGVGNWAVPASGGAGNDWCFLYDTASQNMTYNADTTVLFASEVSDPGGLHSTGSNTGRITIVTAGTYLFFSVLNIIDAKQTAGTNQYRAGFCKNAASVASPYFSYKSQWASAPNLLETQLTMFQPVVMSATDYMEIKINMQGSVSVNGTVGGGNFASFYGCIKIG